jgi:double-strand break repair protein MRE11
MSDTSLIQSGVDNTQDPNLNVGLPIFTIHGNHDDPSGPEHYSAVDILSSVHYVNYFGKHTFCRDEHNDIGKVRLSPLLLVKVCILSVNNLEQAVKRGAMPFLAHSRLYGHALCKLVPSTASIFTSLCA